MATKARILGQARAVRTEMRLRAMVKVGTVRYHVRAIVDTANESRCKTELETRKNGVVRTSDNYPTTECGKVLRIAGKNRLHDNIIKRSCVSKVGKGALLRFSEEDFA